MFDRARGITMTFDGKVRLYFNRHASSGLVWCVASVMPDSPVQGISFETAIRGFDVDDVHLRSRYRGVVRRLGEDDEPVAWLEGDALVEVDAAGFALVSAPRPKG